MSINEFRYWRQKTVVGASLTAVVPGSNRWAVKPEIGLSQRWSRWILDAYGAVWFFTVKNHYYTGRLAQTELPMGAVEMHRRRYQLEWIGKRKHQAKELAGGSNRFDPSQQAPVLQIQLQRRRLHQVWR
jgi:hypothetical protein